MKLPFQKKKQKKKEMPSNETEPMSNLSSFSGKIGQFFNPEPQKEKVLRHEDFNAAGDVYYATVSAGYKVAQRILWLFFVFFLVFSILTNYQAITYDNFFYLIKDFSSAADSGSNYETLSYESDPRQNFTLYRGGVAAVSPSRISIFTSTGRRTLNSTSGFSSPYMVSSAKYLLVYDTSGTTFSVYNSFARIYTETLDYPVTDACFSGAGGFVIVTRSADSRSVVCSYNKGFHKIAELRADYYLFDIAANEERDQLTMLSYEAGNGTGRTVLSVRDMTMTEHERMEFDGEFPLAVDFLEDQRFAVITDRCIRIYDKNLELFEKSEDYSGGTITGYSITAEGIAVSAVLNSKNVIFAFDKSGNLLYNDAVTFTVTDICVYDSYLFLQTEQGITRLHAKSGKEAFLNSGTGKMLIYNATTALVCGESKAEYLIYSNG
ncbi:MAG: hypothetical protein E7668_00740 [Ruminococcaceae bacterium]|nr:hypothetical protein [Oscillospiraceae bacterium]